MIYLDGAATTPVLPCVRTAMFEALSLYQGNPSSLHSSGTSSRNKIEEVRKKVADFIGASPEEIIFTSGATEGNNTVFHTFEGKNIYISPFEHPSVANSAKYYGKDVFILEKSTILSGNLEKDPNSDKIPKKTPSLISCQLANTETGHIFNIKNLVKTLKTLPKRTYFHADATGAIGKIPVNVKDLDIDYLTFSAHKLGGPQGIGVLYVKNLQKSQKPEQLFPKTEHSQKNPEQLPEHNHRTETPPFSPLIFGGAQEHGFRAGTPPVFLIAGLGAAIDYATEKNTISLYETSVRPLKNLLKKEIEAKIPNSITNSPLDKTSSLPELLNVSFPGAEGESTQLYLDLKSGIEVGTGSACASGESSRTLLTLTSDPEIAHSSIRFSLDLKTTEKDIEEIMKFLPDIIKNLRSISTYERKK